jgi:hypothetical protein
VGCQTSGSPALQPTTNYSCELAGRNSELQPGMQTWNLPADVNAGVLCMCDRAVPGSANSIELQLKHKSEELSTSVLPTLEGPCLLRCHSFEMSKIPTPSLPLVAHTSHTCPVQLKCRHYLKLQQLTCQGIGYLTKHKASTLMSDKMPHPKLLPHPKPSFAYGLASEKLPPPPKIRSLSCETPHLGCQMPGL